MVMLRSVIFRIFAAMFGMSLPASQLSFAADIPAPITKAPAAMISTSTWSGFYAGINIGYGFGDGRVNLGLVDASGALQGAAAAGVFPTSFSYNRDGVVGGVQIGFNQQIAAWVWGIEADIQGTGIKASQSVLRPPLGAFPDLSGVTQDMDWLGTARLRAGYATGSWLLFGTGGLAYGHVKYSYFNTNAPFGGGVNIAVSDSQVEAGWTAGAGVEYGWSNWSAKLEYLYYDLGSHVFFAQHNLAPAGVGFFPNFQNSGSIVRVGLNYRFGARPY
jgi:outer membrane immunogenic protein